MNKALLFCHLNPMQHLYQKKKTAPESDLSARRFQVWECSFCTSHAETAAWRTKRERVTFRDCFFLSPKIKIIPGDITHWRR